VNRSMAVRLGCGRNACSKACHEDKDKEPDISFQVSA
jgi:hypothetical protein